MKKVDFVLAYEVKTRELEYLTLLKCELERRGYTVAIDAANALKGWGVHYDTEVAITAGFDLTYANFGNGILFKKTLELTSEQIYSSETIENRAVQADEIEKRAIVNVWGEKFKTYLVEKCGIPSDNVVVYGHPVMDFCKERFEGYYLNREDIALRYNLNKNKKWNLFISSFTLSVLGENGAKEYDESIGTTGISRLYELEMKTRCELETWFRSLLDARKDQYIIYRPHPVEMISDEFEKMEKEYTNFRIIRDYGVRQWIKVCDKLFTWVSTSSVEAHFMRRPIYFLRPYPIDSDVDMEIFNHPERAIDNYTDFMRVVDSMLPLEEFEPFDESINKYYYYDKDVYTYEKLADLCEKMLKDDSYIIPIELRKQLRNNMKKVWKSIGAKNRFKIRMRRFPLYKVYHDLFSPNVDYMNLEKGELDIIESNIKRCICDYKQ